MTPTRRSTRRSFIAVASAALSAPVAAAAANLPVRVNEGDPLQMRVERLEDLNAIRALNQMYARHINSGAHAQLAELFDDPTAAHIDAALCGVRGDTIDDDDVIEIAADRQTATARLRRTFGVGLVIGPDCTLVEMARLQGGGVIVSEELRMLENVYVRRDGIWKFHRSVHRPT